MLVVCTLEVNLKWITNIGKVIANTRTQTAIISPASFASEYTAIEYYAIRAENT